MRTLKRYLLVIGLPAAVVGLAALAVNYTLRERFYDSNVQLEEAHSAATLVEPEYVSEVEYTPDAVAAETEALQQAMKKLDQALLEQTDVTQSFNDPAIADERQKAKRNIEALSKAKPENWDQRRQEAYETVSQYADVVGDQLLAANPQSR